ncbi:MULTISPECIES: hypothetical protein [Olivibacter]|uniref:Uncharacterized protein n=1 Tax=Olivibacter jilunii TaxID=985016 RepID=A0ABW6AXN0_9SPHI
MIKFKLKAKFTNADIKKRAKEIIEANHRYIHTSLDAVGLQFIIDARSKTPDQGGFNDDTGNLRSSIGYLIAFNGKVIGSKFDGQKSEGRTKGKEAAEKVTNEHPVGWAIIFVAGMEYASYVEGYGYDVITGSAIKISANVKDMLDRLASSVFEKI